MTGSWYHEHNIYAIPKIKPHILWKIPVTPFLILPAIALAAVLALHWWIRWASSPSMIPSAYERGDIVSNGSAVRPASRGRGDCFRLVTFNAGYASGATNNTPVRLSREAMETNLDRMGRALAALKADFLVLQEVDFNSRRSYRINQLDWLRRHTGHAHAAIAYNWDVRYLPWPYWPISSHFGRILSGQALLSHYPVQAHHKVTFPKPDTHSSWYNRFFIDRAVHCCSVEINGKILQLAGCHLESFHIEWRRAQARLLATVIAGLPAGPLILAGDFNAIPTWATPPSCLLGSSTEGEARDDTISHIESTGMPGLFAGDRWRTREEESYTFASFMPIACIDHAFGNDGIEILDGGVCRDTGEASDHFPVWMDFRLRDES